MKNRVQLVFRNRLPPRGEAEIASEMRAISGGGIMVAKAPHPTCFARLARSQADLPALGEVISWRRTRRSRDGTPLPSGFALWASPPTFPHKGGREIRSVRQ